MTTYNTLIKEHNKNKDDIVGINEQLAETENRIDDIENANGKSILKIKNYLGNYQNIHPKILYFDNAWNGFKYWMAYTPYPNGDTTAENPCIAVSNDPFVGWITPSGLTNPLDNTPSVGYNSDTHLVYREDTNTMEIWWRHFDDTTNTPTVYRRTSTDGVNWSVKEQITNLIPAIGTYLLSPSIIFEDGKYKMWYCGGQINYVESNGDTVSSWGTTIKKNINFTPSNVISWHLDVIHTTSGYEYLIQGYVNGVGSNNSADLYYVLEDNDGKFSLPRKVISRSSDSTAIDYRTIYRASFFKKANGYFVYYSCIANDGKRAIAISYGKRMDALNGFINTNEYATKEQKILWNGNELMPASSSISLSEKVSEQDNGIVLVFRYLDGTTASNTRIVQHFVPKQGILSFSGGGFSIMLSGYSFDFIGQKYLKITDDTIIGDDKNISNGISNGITYNNSKYVLSMVLGV